MAGGVGQEHAQVPGRKLGRRRRCRRPPARAGDRPRPARRGPRWWATGRMLCWNERAWFRSSCRRRSRSRTAASASASPRLTAPICSVRSATRFSRVSLSSCRFPFSQLELLDEGGVAQQQAQVLAHVLPVAEVRLLEGGVEGGLLPRRSRPPAAWRGRRPRDHQAAPHEPEQAHHARDSSSRAGLSGALQQARSPPARPGGAPRARLGGERQEDDLLELEEALELAGEGPVGLLEGGAGRDQLRQVVGHRQPGRDPRVAPAQREQLALPRQQQEHLVFQQLVAVHPIPSGDRSRDPVI